MTEKTKVIWDEGERQQTLEGAVVERVGRDWMLLRKDGRRIYVEAACYQCGHGYLIVQISESPPQRG
jgi:cbb3-type cytochrome oxidase cytochrome c subunit